ncbi:hypothetical protein PG985_005172 [Apiospora marii]|uniref:Uncharacterized protein n=1 Tax=Apiospora marii TaxID=335849 RepID=A0ABR1SB68_9PEZI
MKHGAIANATSGIYVGSLAAATQSAGAAGTVFSTLQSAAMGGYGLAAVSSVFTGVGAVVGAVVGGKSAEVASEKHDGEEDESDDDKEEEHR